MGKLINYFFVVCWIVLVQPSFTTPALVSAHSAVEDQTRVNRRLFEHELAGANAFMRELLDYELHDFTKHDSTRRVLESVGEKTLHYQVYLLGQHRSFNLERHDDLFAEGYQHHYTDANGRILKSEPALNCIYRSSTFEEQTKTQAFISLCDGLVHGTINAQGDSFSIQPIDPSNKHTLHVVYRHRDLKAPSKKACNLDEHLAKSSAYDHPRDANSYLRQQQQQQQQHAKTSHRQSQVGFDYQVYWNLGSE